MRWITITSGRVSLWLTTLLQLLFVLQAGKCCSCSHLFCGLCVLTSFYHRAALLTGKYPQRVGLAGEEGTPRWIRCSPGLIFFTFVVVLGSVFLHCDKLSGWLCMQREEQACRPVLQHLPLWQGDLSKTQLQNSFFCQLCYHLLTWYRL